MHSPPTARHAISACKGPREPATEGRTRSLLLLRTRATGTISKPALLGLQRDLALQLQFDVGSDSMPHHDWGIMDGGWIGRGDVGAVGVVVAGGQGSDQAVVPAGADGGLGRAVPRCLAWP